LRPLFCLELWIWSCMLDETTTQAPLHCCHPFLLHLVLVMLLLPFLHRFPLHPEQNIYKNAAVLKSIRNYLSNEWSFILNGAWMKELCLFYFSVAFCPEISERTTFNVFAITACRNLRLTCFWFVGTGIS
jgi:hypothetical protein